MLGGRGGGQARIHGCDQTGPAKIDADTPLFIARYAQFYRTPHGYRKRSVNSNGQSGWIVTNVFAYEYADFGPYQQMRTPTLIVAGKKAHSRYMSEDAYKASGSKNKEPLIVPNAVHTDLYDDMSKIHFGKFEEFFKTNLK